METKIVPYTTRKEQAKNQSSATTVWQFLAKGEKGATFELPFSATKYRTANSKYITLNQVGINIGGATETLFIVRDVSHIIYVE
jgi:hypothetical protein